MVHAPLRTTPPAGSAAGRRALRVLAAATSGGSSPGHDADQQRRRLIMQAFARQHSTAAGAQAADSSAGGSSGRGWHRRLLLSGAAAAALLAAATLPRQALAFQGPGGLFGGKPQAQAVTKGAGAADGAVDALLTSTMENKARAWGRVQSVCTRRRLSCLPAACSRLAPVAPRRRRCPTSPSSPPTRCSPSSCSKIIRERSSKKMHSMHSTQAWSFACCGPRVRQASRAARLPPAAGPAELRSPDLLRSNTAAALTPSRLQPLGGQHRQHRSGQKLLLHRYHATAPGAVMLQEGGASGMGGQGQGVGGSGRRAQGLSGGWEGGPHQRCCGLPCARAPVHGARSNALPLPLLPAPVISLQGSGFVWDKRGHVVTNYHVIRGASEVQVSLIDQSTYPAKIVGGGCTRVEGCLGAL